MVRVRTPSLAEVFGFDERWLRTNLSLLDNAKESILHGLEHYLEPDPSASHFKQVECTPFGPRSGATSF